MNCLRKNCLAAAAWMALGSACGGSGGDEGGGESGGGTTTASTTTGSGTTGSGTTGEPTSEEPTTGEPTAGMSQSSTGASESTGGTGGEYCQGFEVEAPQPFLEFDVLGGQPFVDGVTWPLECGGQGLWMFALYPRFGGWDPMSQIVFFDVVVDVEGYNDNPDGHFYSAEMTSYYVGCEILDGGVQGVLPVFPPDTLADLSVLDGLPATVHVEIDVGGQLVSFDASATLQAPKELVEGGCGFG